MSDLADRIAKLSPHKRALLERRMKAEKSAPGWGGTPIAVIGLGCRFPWSADSPDAYWTMMAEGIDAVREVPPERWDADELYDPDSTVRGKMSTRWGGFLNDIGGFDPAFFDITDREAARMDPQQRMLLETVWEALEDAGLTASDIAGSPTGVFVGAHNVSSDYFIRQLRNRTDIDAYSATGGAHSVLANRLSYLFDLQGPSLSVDTACSASLVATHLALCSLKSRECDLAIAGGVNLMLSPETNIALSGMQMMAPDGRCKTFDARADGFVRGEGCGAVLLKRLEDAQRDGDAIYAVVRGSAVNQDGRTNGLTAPNGLSQQKVLRRALSQAGVDGNQIGYVEAHGTGTAMGDPIEVEALAEVIGRPADGIRCPIGSVKTNIGHLEGAAGIAGLIKAVLCLHRDFIPPNLHYEKLNPHISLEGTRLVIPATGMAWPRGETPRFAGVSSFGFGGTNAHIVLEEAPVQLAPTAAVPAREPLLVLSARDAAALEAVASGFIDVLSSDTASYQDICYSAACRRTHFERRMAVMATTGEEAAAALRRHLEGDAPVEVMDRQGTPGEAPRVAWVFSGQGSQHVGMGRRLLETEPVFRETIEQIDEIFTRLSGWSLFDALLTADETRLGRTEVAQPAIFAVELGLAALLEHYGIRPDAVVGHSLGEVAAAFVGGALSLEDAVTVIFHRGRLMQRLHGGGRMAAVSASADAVREALAQGHPGVSIAAVNSPLSVTVSGDTPAVDSFVRALDTPHQVLPVEYAFHSEQLEPLRDELSSVLAGIRAQDPTIAIYSTVRGGISGPGDFGAAYWAKNIRQSVLFADAVGSMADAGMSCFVELGPQAVLGPAIEHSVAAGGHKAAVVGALLRGRPEQTREVLAALHVNGVDVEWRKYFGSDGHAVRLPTYQWQRHRCWFDPSPDASPAPAAGTDVRDWGYEVAWALRTPLDDWLLREPIEGPLPLETVSNAIDKARDHVYEEQEATDSEVLVKALESKALHYAWKALRDLGFALEQGDRYTPDAVAAVAAGYRSRVVERLFRLLGEHGVVTRDHGDWLVCGELGEQDATASRVPGFGAEVMELLDRCGNQVANVVMEKCDPLSLLFPGDYRTSAEWVYAEAPFSRVANDLVGEAVKALIEHLPASRPLRILEIGAGTGGSTRTILPRLPADRAEYVFTDLSQSFLNQASERFATELPIHFALLDLEIDPEEQGFAKGQFDLVIAANVVHATEDLQRSLRHARELLVPGGVLLLLEGTARRGWVDLTFGLTEGWWRFTDTSVRSDHPLLEAEAWTQVLKESGFADATATAAERDPAGCPFEQAIILARAPSLESSSSGAMVEEPCEPTAAWVVFADDGVEPVAAALASDLRKTGTPCVVIEQTDGPASLGDGEIRINPARRDDMVELCRKLPEICDGEPHAILHLAATCENAEGDCASDWDACMTRTCGSVLHLFQALAESGQRPARGVWVATRNTQPVLADGRVTSVAQAPLWGLGRVAAREMPELWGGLVDLDIGRDAASDAAVLRRIVDGDSAENQVVIRGRDRFVARLVGTPLETADAPRFREDRSYLIVGGLGGIGLLAAQWMVTHGARHLTLCSRRGLESASEATVADVVRDLEATGADIKIESADSTDRNRMTALFAGFGHDRPPLAGVIHTAAVIDFQPLEDIGLEGFLGALRAKVNGSWVLHELTSELDLDFMLLFSSMAAIGGFPQLSHYAAGNCFMDALAHRRRELGLPALSVNWGLWSEGGSTSEENKELFERIGLRAMPSAKALQGLSRVMSGDRPQKTVAWVDWDSFRPIYELHGANHFLSRLGQHQDLSVFDASLDDVSRHSTLRSQLDAADPPAALRILEETICDAVATILGQRVDDVAGRGEGFFQMGMDSIMTVELRRRLESKLGLNLPTTLAFEYPTIDRLTAYLAGELLDIQPRQPEAAAEEPDGATTESADDDLDSLSDAELAAELDRELAGLGDAGRSTTG